MQLSSANKKIKKKTTPYYKVRVVFREKFNRSLVKFGDQSPKVIGHGLASLFVQKLVNGISGTIDKKMVQSRRRFDVPT